MDLDSADSYRSALDDVLRKSSVRMIDDAGARMRASGNAIAHLRHELELEKAARIEQSQNMLRLSDVKPQARVKDVERENRALRSDLEVAQSRLHSLREGLTPRDADKLRVRLQKSRRHQDKLKTSSKALLVENKRLRALVKKHSELLDGVFEDLSKSQQRQEDAELSLRQTETLVGELRLAEQRAQVRADETIRAEKLAHAEELSSLVSQRDLGGKFEALSESIRNQLEEKYRGWVSRAECEAMLEKERAQMWQRITALRADADATASRNEKLFAATTERRVRESEVRMEAQFEPRLRQALAQVKAMEVELKTSQRERVDLKSEVNARMSELAALRAQIENERDRARNATSELRSCEQSVYRLTAQRGGPPKGRCSGKA